MQSEKKGSDINRVKVVEHFNHAATVHSNVNAVLDSGRDEEVIFANIYRDYFTRHYILKSIMPGKNEVLLDFGCGVGRISYYLSPKVKRVEGVDVAENMLNIARRKIAGYPNVHFTLLNNATLPFKPGEIDKVFSHWVMQHLSDNDCTAYFKEFYRVLKPGGKLFLFEQVKTNNEQPGNIHVFRTVDEYFTLIESAGFKKVLSKPVMRVPSHGMSIWNKLKFNSKILLRLLSLLDEKLINRKIQFVDYYTTLFVFRKTE